MPWLRSYSGRAPAHTRRCRPALRPPRRCDSALDPNLASAPRGSPQRTSGRPHRPWPRYRTDIETCPGCGGPMRWVEAATEQTAAARGLTRHRLAPEPAPQRRARRPPHVAVFTSFRRTWCPTAGSDAFRRRGPGTDSAGDKQHGPDFDRVTEGAGMDVLQIAPRTPRVNAVCERFGGGVRRERLDHGSDVGTERIRATFFADARELAMAGDHLGVIRQRPQP